MAEKMDMSLDEIIKQNKKKKKAQRRGFQQFRGRVGGKLVKGRNTANRASTSQNIKKGQKLQRSHQPTSAARGRDWRSAAKTAAVNKHPKTTKSSAYKAAQRQLQSKKQKQQRENLINQQRSQSFMLTNRKKRTNKKYGGLVSDQLGNINVTQRKKLNRNFSKTSVIFDKAIAQQKRLRRWKTQVQKDEPVLSVTVPNVMNNEVKVLFKKKKPTRPRINRQTIRSNSNGNPVIMVTSPTSKDNQVEIITCENVRRHKHKMKSHQDKLAQRDEDLPELSDFQPTVNTVYEVNRTDFAKASTGLTLDERFSRMVKYSEQTSPSVVTGERQVFL